MGNTVAARRAVGEIRRSVAILASHPETGRVARHTAGELREWTVLFGQAGYVMLYRYDGRTVFLLAVRHALEAGY
jgi:plasmid stabilization system protein ParE